MTSDSKKEKKVITPFVPTDFRLAGTTCRVAKILPVVDQRITYGHTLYSIRRVHSRFLANVPKFISKGNLWSNRTWQ